METRDTHAKRGGAYFFESDCRTGGAALGYKEAIAEGVGDPYEYQESKWYDERPELLDNCKIAAFAGLWDSTIKKRDLALYGWEANPWVWVIEFERVHEEE